MGLLTWSDRYSVKNSKLDKQHQMLFDYINELYEAMQKGAGQEAAIAIVKKLHSYTLVHFKEEEAMLAAKNSPLLSMQKTEHAKFIQKVEELEEKIRSNSKLTISIEMLRFLNTWLKEHILEKDQQYLDVIND